MKLLKHAAFLSYIKDYVVANPDVAPYVTAFVAGGLQAALEESNNRAAQMEIVAATLAYKKYKGSEDLILQKLRTLRGKTVLNWDWLIGKEADK